jgi:outer membrane biosynthesis protein TonB
MDKIGPGMAQKWAWFLVGSLALTRGICQGQTAIPYPLPELKYPPIARVAHVQGDVVVSFRQTPEGGTVDVKPISGPPMLEDVAVENVIRSRSDC